MHAWTVVAVSSCSHSGHRDPPACCCTWCIQAKKHSTTTGTAALLLAKRVCATSHLLPLLRLLLLQGQIENPSAAGVAAGSVDLVISNCVINLSPDKEAVLLQAYKVLAEGGELFFSGGWALGIWQLLCSPRY